MTHTHESYETLSSLSQIRDAPLPDTTNTFTIRDVINTAIKKPLIPMIEFTTNHHVLLPTKDNTNLPPLSSKTTAQLLRKLSEPPYLLPLASERMKSGTRSSYMASAPPPH